MVAIPIFNNLIGVIQMNNDVLPELINKDDLCRRLSISQRGLENLIKRGVFPPPVRIGKFVYWSESAVKKWQIRTFAAQESWG